MHTRFRPIFLPCCAALVVGLAPVPLAAAEDTSAYVLDYRYAPPNWQTAVCLPDDWQKTLVGKDGALLYDHPGKFGGFGTRLSFEVGESAVWVGQDMASPRVPIVRTTKRIGDVEMLEEAFAVAPLLAPPKSNPGRGAGRGFVERVGEPTGQTEWAKPATPGTPAFRNAAIGWNRPVEFRFPAKPGERFTVAFGLCEGWHTNAAQRVLELRVEDKLLRTVDLAGEFGRNVPAVFRFDAEDANGDGWIYATVAAAPPAPDKNTILSALWVFRSGQAPSAADLVRAPHAEAALAYIDCARHPFTSDPQRNDVLTVRVRNTGRAAATLAPALRLETVAKVYPHTGDRQLAVGERMGIRFSQPWSEVQKTGDTLTVRFGPWTLGPGAEQRFVLTTWRGTEHTAFAATLKEADAARARAVRFWEKADLPYDRVVVPDAAVQGLLDSAIRNIYQAREIKRGLPAFQVGPTVYRGLWVVDGSFLLEAVTYLGRATETRAGIQYLMSFQRPDGGFMLIDGHWKETGIVLWALARHAQLTGDTAWLRSVWPQVRRGVDFIRAMRAMPPADAPNARLIPDGFSDGGLADRVPEYTNIYWTLAGLRAAIAAARAAGEAGDAEGWQREYDDFYATFRRAAERDTRTDAQGHRYVPIRMTHGEGIPPQKAQWAFCHAVFPGQVFAADDPLVTGTLAMLRGCETEGLVRDTGWLKQGIWNYFGSFYAHAWLWLGDGDKAARTLYAFGNHASPLGCWREEHMPAGEGPAVVGDMPHNWASAEFIRLVRHALVLERGDELHLFEAFPATWTKPGARTRLREIATAFGPLSLEFRVGADGRRGTLTLTPPRRTPPTRIVWHLDRWSTTGGTRELSGAARSVATVDLR